MNKVMMQKLPPHATQVPNTDNLEKRVTLVFAYALD
jgi:hypothetical protein